MRPARSQISVLSFIYGNRLGARPLIRHAFKVISFCPFTTVTQDLKVQRVTFKRKNEEDPALVDQTDLHNVQYIVVFVEEWLGDVRCDECVVNVVKSQL